MARRLPNAKRASRANPRADRNKYTADNVLEFVDFEPNTRNKSRSRRNDRRHPQGEDTNTTNNTPFMRKKIELIPRNLAQENYIDALLDESKTVVVAVGPAGTGKTWMAMLHCIKELTEGKIEKIVILRPVVTADGSNLGALPGNIIDKLGPYVGEVMSILKEYLGVKTVLKMLENEIIEILPIALARGRSLRNSAVVIEEAQNIEDHATKLLLTRIAAGSRMYINGDINQTDRGFNGLKSLLRRLEDVGGSDHFAVCHFSKADVERHPVVAETLRIYGEED
jgi:phosphate starvation-inducible PhoH-like protein